MHLWKVKTEGTVNLPPFSKTNVLTLTLCFNETNIGFEKSFTELYDINQEALTFKLEKDDVSVLFEIRQKLKESDVDHPLVSL